MQARTSAELIGALVETGTFRTWDTPREDAGLAADYVAELQQAQAASGRDEAVITGEGVVGGYRVALIISEFGFIGGSIGVQTATRIVRALDRAAELHLPLVGALASGGTRMQEGTAAFVHMREITAAFMRHRAQHLPSIMFLCHPSFGGALASWGSLATVTIAQEHAAIGLLGPRIQRAVAGETLPLGIQRAEHLLEFGLVDDVAPFEEFASRAAEALDLLCGPDRPDPELGHAIRMLSRRAEEPGAFTVPADRLARSADGARAGVRDLIAALPGPTVWLRGSASDGTGPTVLCIVRIAGVRALIVGQDRAAPRPECGTDDLKRAREGIRVAHWLGLPIVTVVDTPGAELSAAAEEGGLAGEIAMTLAALASRTVPVVTLLLGQGTGAAAVALFGGDVVVAAEGAWLAAMPLEGAAEILFGDSSRAVDAAAAQRVSAAELLADGIVDRVVSEPATVAAPRDAFAGAVLEAVAEELIRLVFPAGVHA